MQANDGDVAMRRLTLTVAQKIAAGYLIIVLFSLVALGYALHSLQRQTTRSRQLVEVDFRAFNLLRELRQTTIAQDGLEQQLLVLRDPSLLDLADRRRTDFTGSWKALDGLHLPAADRELGDLIKPYLAAQDRCTKLEQEGSWQEAADCAEKLTAPARKVLLTGLDQWSRRQQSNIDRALQTLSEGSRKAYRITLLLILCGLACSAPVAWTVIFSIHRSVRSLVHATQKIAAGSFDHQIALKGRDEFGKLAREFNQMGRKLKELEARSLDANPLTRLPGNLAIERELKALIAAGCPFAHLYIDLDNFKAYGDRYGYRAGSEVIAQVGDLIRKAVRDCGSETDLVGHIGGDDYVILTSPEQAEAIARQIIADFDRLAPGFYTHEDRTAGSFLAQDRFGVERSFPLLTISIAIIRSETLDTATPETIGQECARIKQHLKELPGSNLLVNRRKTR